MSEVFVVEALGSKPLPFPESRQNVEQDEPGVTSKPATAQTRYDSSSRTSLIEHAAIVSLSSLLIDNSKGRRGGGAEGEENAEE